ncbi:MAG: hypothetical protein ABEH43_06920, partial [Flavobacteriales bacterium]
RGGSEGGIGLPHLPRVLYERSCLKERERGTEERTNLFLAITCPKSGPGSKWFWRKNLKFVKILQMVS